MYRTRNLGSKRSLPQASDLRAALHGEGRRRARLLARVRLIDAGAACRTDTDGRARLTFIGSVADNSRRCGFFSPTVPVILMLGTLFQGPFVHMHSESVQDHGHTGTHGTTLHNHFPIARAKAASAHDEPSFDAPYHAGRDIDVLLSTEGKAFPGAGAVDACSDLFPKPVAARLDEVRASERTRDPPRPGLPPRAPPA